MVEDAATESETDGGADDTGGEPNETEGDDQTGGELGGCQDWERPVISGAGADLVLTEAGSLWVTTWVPDGGEETNDWAFARYDLEAQELASGQFGGALDDTIVAIAAGPDDGLHIYGRLDQDPESDLIGGDVTVARVDAEANVLWSTVVELDEGAIPFEPWDVGVSDDGSAYVIGGANNPDTDLRYSFVSKYGGGGGLEWGDLLFATPMFISRAEAVTVHGADNVYVFGNSAADLEGNPGAGVTDAWSSRYSADGTREWFTLTGTEDREIVDGAAHDSEGNAYFIVHRSPFGDPAPIDSAILTKVDPSGEVLWSIEESDGIRPEAVSTDDAGNVYVSYSLADPGPEDPPVYVAKYDPGGELQWTEEMIGVEVVVPVEDELYFAGGGSLFHVCAGD